MRAMLLGLALLMTACVAPQNLPASQTVAVEQPSAAANSSNAVAPADDLAAAITGNDTQPGGANVVDSSCRTDADCTIKDVGSCCGYRPQCVNKDSPTFPEQVKANCAKQGRVGICGFPAISACQCQQGKCAGISDGSSVQ